ncbi:MAG: ATP-binding protein [Pseudomonadota bacterium]
MPLSNRMRDRNRIEAMVGRVTLEAFLRNQPCDEPPVCLRAETLTRLLHRVEELSRFASSTAAHDVRFSTQVDPSLVFMVHRPSLFRSMMILVENAFDAVLHGGGGRVAVDAKAVFGEVCITITDDGAGLPDAWRDALRSRALLPATGGLSKVVDLADRMDGTLRLVRTGPSGTSLALDLPNGAFV